MGNLIKNTKMNFVDLDTTLDFLGDIEDAIKRFREALEEGRDDSVVESTTQEKKRKSSSTSPGSAKKTKLSEKEKQEKKILWIICVICFIKITISQMKLLKRRA